MKITFRNLQSTLRTGLVAILLALGLENSSQAVTVTATTSDNGYPAHLVQWTDASGNARSAMMVDANSTAPGPYAGYMRQYTYLVNGVARVCTGTTDYKSDGALETAGFGFLQLHSPYYPYDISSGNGSGSPGTTTISPSSGTFSHVTVTYSMQALIVASDNTQYTLPSTIQWLFADGKNDPVFAVTHDATSYVNSNTADLGLDTVSPYGAMQYGGPGDPIVGGFSYGDQYKFVTVATGPEEVTLNSGWKATDANIIPYTMQWIEPSSVDAEMGNVATVPLTVSDAGQDTQTYNDPPQHTYIDYRNRSAAAGTKALAKNADQAFDIVAYQILTEGLSTSATDDKHLTWGSNYGRVGGLDLNAYNNGLAQVGTTSTYPMHSNDLAPGSDYSLASFLAAGSADYSPSTQSFSGTTASGAMASYSVFVVLGTHNGGTANVVGTSFKTGAVGKAVTQMENAAQATFSVSTGTIIRSGPSGIGPAASVATPYSPIGYNPIYSTWELAASGNAAHATLTPAAGKTVSHPVFLIDSYNSTQLPTSISINGNSRAGIDYFATVDPTGRLWITANSDATTTMTLDVVAPPASPAISLSGNMAFGNVPINTSTTSTLTISNPGTANLVVSSITYPNGFSGNYASGSIAIGASQNVIVTFSPTVAVTYSGGNIVVNSNAASGNGAIAASGTGTGGSSGSDPFGGTLLGGGYYYSAWFGIYNAQFYPWIYRTDLGFIYVDAVGTDLYLYVDSGRGGTSMGWVYTNQTIYPNEYCFAENSWLYYFTGGTSFYNYTTGQFETY